jgi:hypothetical protein
MPNILYDPDRIKPFMEIIESKWREYPHMRFGQLIVNLSDSGDIQNLWNIEDRQFKNHIESWHS